MSSLEAPRTAKSVWLISFGDLLTLLVAYFVMGISLQLKLNQDVTSKPEGSSGSGTSVAKSVAEQAFARRDEILAEFVFFDPHMESRMTSELKTKIKSFASRRDMRVELLACDVAHFKAEQTLEAMATLAGDTLAKAPFFLETVGSSCSSIRTWTPVTKTPVAVVRIVSVGKES